MIAGVIFDLGSTLIHFDGDWQAVFSKSLHALARQLKADGITLKPSLLREAFRRQVEPAQAERQKDCVERTSGLRPAASACGSGCLPGRRRRDRARPA